MAYFHTSDREDLVVCNSTIPVLSEEDYSQDSVSNNETRNKTLDSNQSPLRCVSPKISFSSSKNGIIASAIDNQKAVCLSFKTTTSNGSHKSEHDSEISVIPQASAIAPVKLHEKHSDRKPSGSRSPQMKLCLSLNKEVGSSMANHVENLIASEGKDEAKLFKEFIIDGFSILSFKNKEDLIVSVLIFKL